MNPTGNVRTAGKPQYPGDTFKRIEIEYTNGEKTQWSTVFGVYKSKGVWHNDTYAGYDYQTLAEAKQHALDLAERGHV